MGGPSGRHFNKQGIQQGTLTLSINQTELSKLIKKKIQKIQKMQKEPDFIWLEAIKKLSTFQVLPT